MPRFLIRVCSSSSRTAPTRTWPCAISCHNTGARSPRRSRRASTGSLFTPCDNAVARIPYPWLTLVSVCTITVSGCFSRYRNVPKWSLA